jgi:hypothetical protein
MVGSGVGVMSIVCDGGIGDGVVVSVGVGTAEVMVLSFEATELSDLLVTLSHEVKVKLKMSKNMKITLLIIITWSSSFIHVKYC